MDARFLPLALLLCCLPATVSLATVSPVRAADGGRGRALAICLLAPAATSEPDGVVRAVTPVADPTIFARGQFEEIRLERGGHVLWSRKGTAFAPLEGPQVWPLPALRPGERLWLRLRPVGVAGGDFADVELIGAGATTLERTARLRQALGRDPQAWLQSVLAALDAARTEEALALLFDVQGPSSSELNGLRREVHDRACDSAILGSQDSSP